MKSLKLLDCDLLVLSLQRVYGEYSVEMEFLVMISLPWRYETKILFASFLAYVLQSQLILVSVKTIPSIIFHNAL